ncbi:polysaccharide deacetylase [Acuticoccus sp. MNP-M23]|uniref:polysaccharide deacetylase n=1 Tax=Acuticoccus sp. MNP-M23 TaxID=3072793 RepID=UPI0028149F72|nr:polysaccharide deacetylase [Acuticoccus sp. MNP-M23]WMS40996.1 polysaccharide deacetylase [Acuticoccus sp. MNP-M23]
MTPLAQLESHLDRSVAAPRVFWWRDDDAVLPGPKLDRLADCADRAGAPLALAAIPARAKPALLAFAASADISILQHGVAHENHQSTGKAAELGDGRPVAAIIEGLTAARRRLAGEAFVPVLVPPWNRMRPELGPALADAGYIGLSLYGEGTTQLPLRRVDTHIDPIAWRSDRSLAPDAALAAMIDKAIAQDGPIGILTHHIDHDDAIEGFVTELAALVARHPGARWAGARELFGTAP